MENIKTLIQENKDCKMEKGVLCAQHCRDCRYMEMENDHYNDGNRRCACQTRRVLRYCGMRLLDTLMGER